MSNISGADVTCEIDNVLADIQSNAAMTGSGRGRRQWNLLRENIRALL